MNKRASGNNFTRTEEQKKIKKRNSKIRHQPQNSQNFNNSVGKLRVLKYLHIMSGDRQISTPLSLTGLTTLNTGNHGKTGKLNFLKTA